MPLSSKTINEVKRFLADERGAAAIEFLMTLPLLIGVMVFTAEYGNALRTKMVLNTATADVTRFLARSPIQEAPEGSGNYAFYQPFLDDAKAILEARMGGSVVLDTSITLEDNLPYTLRTPPFVIVVRTDVGLSMPLLGFINQTVQWANGFDRINPPGTTEILPTLITMSSQMNAVWVAGSAVGAADCNLVDRGLNLCDPAEAGT